MIIEVYKRNRGAVLYSDEFSVECRLPNLFMSNHYRSAQSDYLHSLFITFKPARTTFKITPYFFIEGNILNSPDLRLENFYDCTVSTLFDILDIKFLQSNTLPDYKSTLDLTKVCTIEVSQEEFKEFILRVIDKVYMSCLFYIVNSKSQIKQLYILRTWLYNYFPGTKIHYIENELMKQLKQYITKTL